MKVLSESKKDHDHRYNGVSSADSKRIVRGLSLTKIHLTQARPSLRARRGKAQALGFTTGSYHWCKDWRAMYACDKLHHRTTTLAHYIYHSSRPPRQHTAYRYELHGSGGEADGSLACHVL